MPSIPSTLAGDELLEWWRDIYSAFKDADVRQIAYVPDAGHAALINACIADADMKTVPLTTEEEGIALLAGAWLGGERGALLMQSSGVGDCINMMSLAATCEFPLAVFVTMRGLWREFNPWQAPMGKTTAAHLELCGFSVVTATMPEDVGDLARATLQQAYEHDSMTALLLHQCLMPVKTFGK
jgi:sulfopyruvate decarboxylase alpha subunit